jgi:hypothetical protein
MLFGTAQAKACNSIGANFDASDFEAPRLGYGDELFGLSYRIRFPWTTGHNEHPPKAAILVWRLAKTPFALE